MIKNTKDLPKLNIDEMLESTSIFQYMLENGDKQQLKKFYEAKRSVFETAIRLNILDLDFTKSSFVRRLNKYIHRNINEITDQEIADEICYLDMLPKQIETIKSIQLINEDGCLVNFNFPSDIIILKDKYSQLTNELINFKKSIHERITQLFIDRIDEVRKKISSGELEPNYDDEDASKNIDKFNLVYKRLIDEMKN